MNLVTHTYEPCFNRVLIKFIPKEGSNIILPDGKESIGGTMIVKAIGPDVKCCQIGDAIVLDPQAKMVGVSEEEKLAIIADNAIVAIIK